MSERTVVVMLAILDTAPMVYVSMTLPRLSAVMTTMPVLPTIVTLSMELLCVPMLPRLALPAIHAVHRLATNSLETVTPQLSTVMTKTHVPTIAVDPLRTVCLPSVPTLQRTVLEMPATRPSVTPTVEIVSSTPLLFPTAMTTTTVHLTPAKSSMEKLCVPTLQWTVWTPLSVHPRDVWQRLEYVSP